MTTKPSIKSFREAMWVLEQEGLDREAKDVHSLPLKVIKTATTVFQPRNVEQNFLRSDQHIKTLTKVILEAEGHVLEPLTVWWSGRHWYVIDGHHRLEAYKKAKPRVKLPAIPVTVYNGSLNQAIQQSGALNCKDKLVMSLKDKLERAWKLVCLPEQLTKVKMKEATGVSERTVANMRKTKAELEAKGKGNLLDMTWTEAKRGETTAKDELWEEKLATEWQKRLVKVFGTKLSEQPAVAARAIELYSPKLLSDIVEWMSTSEDEEATEEVDEGGC